MNKKVAAGLLASIGLMSSAHADTFTSADICKAAISVEMGRPTKTMKTKQAEPNPEISYRRPDGDSFRYRCQISED